jgi:gliding motility-associated-like protein
VAMGATASYSICEGVPVTLTGTTGGGTTWEWLDSNNNSLVPLSSDPTNQTFKVSPASTTTYYFVGHNQTCVGQQTEIVTVKNHVNFSVNPDTLIACKNTIAAITPTNILPATGVNYAWSVDGATPVNINIFNVPTTIAKSGIITLTSSATGYCDKTMQIPYIIAQLKIAPKIWSTSFCSNDNNVELAVDTTGTGPIPTGSLKVQWLENGVPAVANTLDAIFTPTKTSTYQVIVSTGTCTQTYPQIPQTIKMNNVGLELGPDFFVCPNDKVTLVADTTGTGYTSGIYELSWSKQLLSAQAPVDMNITGNRITDYPQESTRYIVNVVNNGCKNVADVLVSTYPSPEITNILDLLPKEVQIIAANGTQPYQYNVDNTSNYVSYDIFSNLRVGDHMAYIIDENSCKASKLFSVSEVPLDFPSHFTPNGDGINDTWKIKNVELYDEIDLQIFDRFGKNLIKITDPTISWDGTYLGNKCPSTDYWYVLYIKEIGKKYVGHFTLIN